MDVEACALILAANCRSKTMKERREEALAKIGKEVSRSELLELLVLAKDFAGNEYIRKKLNKIIREVKR